MTQTYTVDINTADGHQIKRVDADGYVLNPDGSLTLFILKGDSKFNIALFAADKWIVIRDTTPVSMLLRDLAVIQSVT
jgi:hypothetical protein